MRVITHSMVIRSEWLKTPQWFGYIQQGDLSVMLILSLAGPIYYFSDIMGIYRKHATSLGATSSPIRTDLRKRDLLSYFDYYTDFKYHSLIISRKEEYQKQLYFQYLKTTGKYRKFLNFDYFVFKLRHLQSKIAKKMQKINKYFCCPYR